MNAAHYSASVGLPLNAMLTLRWSDAEGWPQWGSDRELDFGQWALAERKLNQAVARWLKARGITPSWVWVRERVKGKGPHIHIILHLGSDPEKMVEALSRFAHRVGRFKSPQAFREGDTGFGDWTYSCGAHVRVTDFPWMPSKTAGLLAYVAKGMDASAYRTLPTGETENLRDILGLEHRGQQGIIRRKRSGVSQNLGPRARRKARWVEQKDIEALRRLLFQRAVLAPHLMPEILRNPIAGATCANSYP